MTAQADAETGVPPPDDTTTVEIAEVIAHYRRRAEAWEHAAAQEETQPDRTSYRAQVARHCRSEAADRRALAALLAAAAGVDLLPDAALIAAAERIAVKVFPREEER